MLYSAAGVTFPSQQGLCKQAVKYEKKVLEDCGFYPATPPTPRP